MKTDELIALLTLIQTTFIFLTFVCLVWQLKKLRQSMRQDAYSRAIEDYYQMTNRLIDKPCLNQFFYKGNSDFQALDKPAQDFYNYLALSFALFERIFLLSTKKEIEPRIWASWKRWLIDAWFRADHFDIFWRHERTFFTTDFTAFIDREYQQFTIQNKVA